MKLTETEWNSASPFVFKDHRPKNKLSEERKILKAKESLFCNHDAGDSLSKRLTRISTPSEDGKVKESTGC